MVDTGESKGVVLWRLGPFHSLWVRYPEACFGLVGGTGLSVDCMGRERVCRGLVKCPGARPGDLYSFG